MKSVKMIADPGFGGDTPHPGQGGDTAHSGDPERSAGDRWYVTNGIAAVGPVNLDQLNRGIEAGRVPLESFVRHEAWKVWRPLMDVAVVTPEADTAQPGPAAKTDDITSPGRPATTLDLTPADALAGAADLDDALLLLLAAVVQRTFAEGAIIHKVEDTGAVVACAHGPKMFDVLGQRTRLLDPVMVAAAAGNLVVAEPAPGPAGKSLLTRMGALGLKAAGALMLPIRPYERLLGALEIGRAAPFGASEMAAAEALVDALVETIEARGWAR